MVAQKWPKQASADFNELKRKKDTFFLSISKNLQLSLGFYQRVGGVQ